MEDDGRGSSASFLGEGGDDGGQMAGGICELAPDCGSTGTEGLMMLDLDPLSFSTEGSRRVSPEGGQRRLGGWTSPHRELIGQASGIGGAVAAMSTGVADEMVAGVPSRSC